MGRAGKPGRSGFKRKWEERNLRLQVRTSLLREFGSKGNRKMGQ